MSLEAGPRTTGTLAQKDLVRVFMDALDDAIEASLTTEGTDHPSRVSRVGAVHDVLGDLERRIERPGYFEDEEQVDRDLETLRDWLDEFAAHSGMWWGALEGDPTQYGFWTFAEGLHMHLQVVIDVLYVPGTTDEETAVRLERRIQNAINGGLLAQGAEEVAVHNISIDDVGES